MDRISRNFTYSEMEYSDTAVRMRIPNCMGESEKRNARELVLRILQPLRDAWGSGIRITSGYRSPNLNRLVGGSVTSAHQSGNAADLWPANGRIEEFYRFTENWLTKNNIAFDQCIRERNAAGSRWLHIGLRTTGGKQRREFKSMLKR